MTRPADQCRRFLFQDADIRGEVVTLERSYQELVANKAYPPVVQRLLGEFVAAAVLLSMTIKFAGRLVLQARSGGEVSLVMAECTSDQHMRGIARYTQIPVDSDFQTLLRQGVLAITIEPDFGESYQGIVPLDKGSLAACLQEYFQRSEQLDSRVYLAADARCAAGLLIQQLPTRICPDPATRAEHWGTVVHLADTVKPQELLYVPQADLLYRLFHELPVTVFDPQPVEYRCSCSRERTARALFSLGAMEVMGIPSEQGGVDVNCEFCGRQYVFDTAELNLLFNDGAGQSIH